MSKDRDATKAERFEEFKRRLIAAPAASGFDEAFRQIGDILNAVEDEMTSIPFDPANWQTDGRMYPPQMDSERANPGQPGVRRFVTKGHGILIRDNGAIEIRQTSGLVVLSKPGADGRAI